MFCFFLFSLSLINVAAPLVLSLEMHEKTFLLMISGDTGVSLCTGVCCCQTTGAPRRVSGRGAHLIPHHHIGSKGLLRPCTLKFRWLALGGCLELGLVFGDVVTQPGANLGKHLQRCCRGRR